MSDKEPKSVFPIAAIEFLRQARWSTDAKRSFEIMSGGFYWSDEMLREVERVCFEYKSWAYRFILAYRASLIRGAPREDLRNAWYQLKDECPDWPGFRPERCDRSLAAELDRESKKACDDLDELDRKFK